MIKVSYSSKRIYFSLKKDTDHIKVLVFWGPWVRNDKNVETKQKLKVPTIINKLRYGTVVKVVSKKSSSVIRKSKKRNKDSIIFQSCPSREERSSNRLATYYCSTWLSIRTLEESAFFEVGYFSISNLEVIYFKYGTVPYRTVLNV